MAALRTSIKCNRFQRLALVAATFLVAGLAGAQMDPVWQNLSSKRGEIPAPPGGSTQQTAALVGDFDGNGINDFILAFREKAPALVLYRRVADGWKNFVIETNYLAIEAGGAACDIAGNGNLDVVFGGDYSSDSLWWWENPGPHADPNVPWKRHLIKSGGAHQFHDQVFGDFLGTGRPQLVFWNNSERKLYLAEIPKDPKSSTAWPLLLVATVNNTESAPYPEGLCAFDVDGDGRLDIIAYDTWYKYQGDRTFKPVKFAHVGGRVVAGYFKPSKVAQIVVASGDGNGPLRWYECPGNPENANDWIGHDLLDRETIHAHSLKVGDINRDGHLDIFCAEMAKWVEPNTQRDNPTATAWVFYGDGKGGFTKTEIVEGNGWHEAQLADLDGDGDLDILSKPYNWDAPRVDIWLNGGTRRNANGVGTSASFQGPVGLQLYSLRDILSTNVAFGLQCARNFGFRDVELAGTYGVAPLEFRDRLSWFGLKPISGIWDYDLFANHLEDVIKDSKSLGLHYAGVGWIPHGNELTEADVRAAAAVFNRAGAALAKAGITFFYHPHGYEFVPRGQGTLFNLLMSETDRSLVKYEMDIFWVLHAGQDPVKLLDEFSGRWELMHLKDLRPGVKTGLIDGNEDTRNDVPVGTGQIDVPSVLQKAQAEGVKYYFIEDESPTPMRQIPQSVRYLESVAW
jgi:sugar phosphate isomerase/epimerase